MNIKNLSYNVIFCYFFSLVVISCNLHSSHPILEAYLYRVIDNYPQKESGGNCQLPNYTRWIQMEFGVKNNTKDTLFLPISIVNGYNSFHSKIVLKEGNKKYKESIDQRLMYGKNDAILAPGNHTTIKILLYDTDLKRMGIQQTISSKQLINRISFIFYSNQKDFFYYKIPFIMFYNSNKQNKIDIKDIEEETKQSWDVNCDTINKIVYAFYKSGMIINPIKTGNAPNRELSK